MKKVLAFIAALLWLGGSVAFAAPPNSDTYFGTPGGGGVNGAVGMCLNYAGQAIPAGPNCATGFAYAHIAAGAAATHVVKASAGTLHTICFNGPATSTNVTTVYDNATGSGNIIAVAAATAVTFPECETFDINFALGLTIITTTANGGDMTISYQ